MPAASTASVAASRSWIGVACGRRRAIAPLLARRFGHFRQFVGDDEPGHQDEAGIADLAPFLRELGDLVVDILAELANAILLAVVARDRIGAAIDGEHDLRHYGPSTALRRRIAASRRLATWVVLSSSAARSAFASARAAARRRVRPNDRPTGEKRPSRVAQQPLRGGAPRPPVVSSPARARDRFANRKVHHGRQPYARRHRRVNAALPLVLAQAARRAGEQRCGDAG